MAQPAAPPKPAAPAPTPAPSAPRPAPAPTPVARMPALIKPARRVNKFWVHCSASDHAHHDDVSVMRQWHKARGWQDVGYHFFIKKDGTIQPGRNINLIPSAQVGHNTGAIAVCLHGLDKRNFTEAQFISLRALSQAFNAMYGGALTFHGHREVAAKECPVFDYKRVLGLDAAGRLFAVKPS